jgi:site-specific DNA-methyltransferase (adenine-specific)
VIFKKKSFVESPIFNTGLGSLYNLDCVYMLSKIKDENFDLIFADPPFNLNKDYGKLINDNLTEEIYISWCKSWLSECYRVLKTGGSLFIWNLPRWNIELSHHLRALGAEFRNWIAVDMKNSMPIKGRLYPAHYSIIYFTKGKPKTFNKHRIPIQLCRHCGKEIKDYGGYRDKIHNDGINLTDIWYDISPVRHRNKKNRIANELPEKLVKRIIELGSNTGDLILDPFGGSGTTYAVCEKLHRHWVGIEIGDCSSIIERFKKI